MPSGKIMLAGIEKTQKRVIVLGAYMSNDAIASAGKTDDHCHTIQGHPTTIFGKISVRKTI